MQVPIFSLNQQMSEIGHELDIVVSKVISSGQYIGGQEVETFEKEFAKSISVPFAVGCNSGTDALMLALRALDIGHGDEVITSSFSFFATAEAISNVGATPIFVDVDPSTFLIDLNLIEQAITPSTKAILPVHLFGRPVDMDAVLAIANNYGLRVIEDCAQAAGAVWGEKPVGGLGDVGCFSFFPTKNLGAIGDAGAVTTHDLQIARRMREIAVHGMPKRYFHTQLGYNSRLDAIQAAVLNVKLPRLSQWVKRRQQIASRYQKLLKDIQEIELPKCDLNEDMLHSWNQFVVKIKDTDLINIKIKESPIKFEKNSTIDLPDASFRDWFKEGLSQMGVGTIIYYPIPIHKQPIYKELGYQDCNLPNTEQLSSSVLSLPIFPELTISQQDYVIDSIKKLLDY